MSRAMGARTYLPLTFGIRPFNVMPAQALLQPSACAIRAEH